MKYYGYVTDNWVFISVWYFVLKTIKFGKCLCVNICKTSSFSRVVYFQIPPNNIRMGVDQSAQRGIQIRHWINIIAWRECVWWRDQPWNRRCQFKIPWFLDCSIHWKPQIDRQFHIFHWRVAWNNISYLISKNILDTTNTLWWIHQARHQWFCILYLHLGCYKMKLALTKLRHLYYFAIVSRNLWWDQNGRNVNNSYRWVFWPEDSGNESVFDLF